MRRLLLPAGRRISAERAFDHLSVFEGGSDIVGGRHVGDSGKLLLARKVPSRTTAGVTEWSGPTNDTAVTSLVANPKWTDSVAGESKL
jgi:hypothetical protein